MLSELADEQIEGNYWYANYGPFRVVMMKDSGYVNTTKMCIDSGKKFQYWKQQKASQELVRALDKMLAKAGEPSACITIEKRNAADSIIPGTYCHPDLIASVAFWLSPAFAVTCSKRIMSDICSIQ